MLVSVLGVSHVWGLSVSVGAWNVSHVWRLSVSVGAWCVPCVGVEC